LQRQGELRSSLRRTSLYRRGGSEVWRNDSSEQRYTLESDSKCMQWRVNTPIEMTSRTLTGTTPLIKELCQGNLKKSTHRMTAHVCVEKSDVDGAGTSTTRSTVATPISDVLGREAATSLRPTFFTPPSTIAPPQKIGRVTESCEWDEPTPSGREEFHDLWNPFKEPFICWEHDHLQKLQGQRLRLHHPRPQQPKRLERAIAALEVDVNL